MKNKKLKSLFIFILMVSATSLNSQSLLDKLNNEFKDKPIDVIATFKSSRIALGHSVETRKKGALQLLLYNRYWDKPNTQSQKFLADEVNTRYGLEYAFTDNFTAGFGYSNFDKIYDGYLKYRILHQQINTKKKPISITFLQSISNKNIQNSSLYGPSTSSRTNSFTSQILIARKINSNLSLQIAPTFVYRGNNVTNVDSESNFAIGFSGRQKITPHTSIVSEYYYVANTIKSINTYNAFTVGVNWEVSDLILQFYMTNARNFAEDTFITQTTNNFNFKDPNFHFGFNATFILHTKKKKL